MVCQFSVYVILRVLNVQGFFKIYFSRLRTEDGAKGPNSRVVFRITHFLDIGFYKNG